MRTTLDLPERLIEEAMRISKAKTKSSLIKQALEELIEREKRRRLLSFKGRIDLNVDLDTLRDR